jgi:hypothetical protein
MMENRAALDDHTLVPGRDWDDSITGKAKEGATCQSLQLRIDHWHL